MASMTPNACLPLPIVPIALPRQADLLPKLLSSSFASSHPKSGHANLLRLPLRLPLLLVAVLPRFLHDSAPGRCYTHS